MTIRVRSAVAIICAGVLGAVAASPSSARAQAQTGGWVVPRTPDGHPDLQGNWTNATITPIERPDGQPAVFTAEQAAQIERRRADRIEEAAEPSDPDRPAPPVGGDGSTGAAGGVGGYNYFFIDAGDHVAMFDGEYRSSLITRPANGRRPALTAAAQQRLADRRRQARQFGPYDNPENRPLSERCVMSFGSNAGPPMTPNYFYNNNYTIVQTPDYVVIMTEMVHDARIIKLGAHTSLPRDIRPWMGDSWGRWDGDTLVVETTNINPQQAFQGVPATSDLRVIERFTRADANTINYEFTVIDPTTYTEPWGGEIPYKKLDAQVYEYACHEGNYSLADVLSGARAEERAAREDVSNQR